MSLKALEYYMSQNYPVEVRAIPEELGGGYSASIPSLGPWTFFAEGDTREEALCRLDETKRDLFADMIANGKEIPDAPSLPEYESETYSGRILVRVPRSLHRDLAQLAHEEGCSVNTLIVSVLERFSGGKALWSICNRQWQMQQLESQMSGSCTSPGSPYKMVRAETTAIKAVPYAMPTGLAG